jgi:DNA-binding XRE family transcriptional regulator
MTDRSHAIVVALMKKKESLGWTWEQIAKQVGVTERTLYNCVEWHLVGGKQAHEPSRKTVRCIATWLRDKGVFVRVP